MYSPFADVCADPINRHALPATSTRSSTSTGTRASGFPAGSTSLPLSTAPAPNDTTGRSSSTDFFFTRSAFPAVSRVATRAGSATRSTLPSGVLTIVRSFSAWSITRARTS